MTKIGDAVPRYEDARLLTGQGSYTDDKTDALDACLIVVRSDLPPMSGPVDLREPGRFQGIAV